MTNSVQCTVCDNAAKPDPFYYVWNGKRFDIYRCTDCSHQFVYPSVRPDEQSQIYGDRYFSKDGDWVCGLIKRDYIDAEEELRTEAREILGMLPMVSGRLIDIGCAGGIFLDEARSAGFTVSGIELNASMAQHARDVYGLDVQNAAIEQVSNGQWQRAFDVVSLLDCLEHIPQPRVALVKVRDWLKPGGVVLIRGPLSNTALAHKKEALRRLLRIQKQLPGYPLDANMFNKRSLTRLLSDTGFEGLSWIGEVPGFANVIAWKTVGARLSEHEQSERGL